MMTPWPVLEELMDGRELGNETPCFHLCSILLAIIEKEKEKDLVITLRKCKEKQITCLGGKT